MKTRAITASSGRANTAFAAITIAALPIAAIAVFAAAALLFAGCSVVFTSSVSGEVHDSELYDDDSDTSGIQDMEIYLYTEEAGWTADLAAWDGGLGVLPDEEDEEGNVRYFLKTVSDDSGSFSFNGLIWNALTPEYGKSGDRREIFLLFSHETYGLTANTTPVYIVSDVTNVLPPFKIDRIMNVATIEGYVRDVEGSDDEGLANVTVSIWVPLTWSYDDSGTITGLDDEEAWDDTADYTVTTDEEGLYHVEIVYPMLPSVDDNEGTCRVRVEYELTSYIAENGADDNITDEGWDPDDDGYDNPYYESPVISADTTTEMDDIHLTHDTNTATVSGTVEDSADGSALANVTVDIYIPDEWTYGTGGAITVPADAWDPDPSYTVTTGADGTYSVEVEYDRLPSRTDNRGTAPMRIVFSRDQYIFDSSLTDTDLVANTGDDLWDTDGDGKTTEDVPADDDPDYYEANDSTGLVEDGTTYQVPVINGKRIEFNETLSGRVFEFGGTVGQNGAVVKIDTHSKDGSFASADLVYNGSQTQVVGDTIEKGHFEITGITWSDDSYSGQQSSLVIGIMVYADDGTTALLSTAKAYTLYSNGNNYVEIETDIAWP